MLSIFDCFREMTQTAVVLRLGLAMVCGGLIGLEREIKHRAAGFRTHILICMGAAITTLTSQYLYLETSFFTDPARLGAQVIAGIGFIGAGAILVTRQNRIKGLTTAAGLWVCAIIGLACGAGYAECAIIAAVIVLIAELFLIKIENYILGFKKERRYYIGCRNAQDLNDILDYLQGSNIKVSEVEIFRRSDTDISFWASLTLRPLNRKAGKDINAILNDCKQIGSYEQL